MKTIQPVQIWYNGSLVNATILFAKIVADNLINEAIIYYKLLSNSMQGVAEGNIKISGTEYANWNGSNDATWQIVANSLNITIISDYTPQP